jgi:hypothetical protein
VIAPVIIEGLPPEIEALGMRWQRKREFHLTAASANVLVKAGRGRPDLWDLVREVADGRSIGPVSARREIRHVRDPARPGLRTLVMMVDAPALTALHADLSSELGSPLHPPPAHVTLYSTDPARGIGLDHGRHLTERAPELTEAKQREVRQAMYFDEVFGRS